MRGGRQIEDERHQQTLRFEPAGRQLLHHPFEQHPLVRHVLIDDRDAVGVDRDDERIAELTERNEGLDFDGRQRRARRARRGFLTVEHRTRRTLRTLR